jgi:hypothetical protein
MVQQLDDADAAPGYPCFGGPGAGIQTWLGAWAPGGMGGMYPPDTGIRVEPGSKIVLQVHYNLQSAAGDTSDQTHVEVALADSVAHPAILLPWANYDWSMGSGMDIPAFQADVEHDFLHDPTPYMAQWSGGQIQANVPLHLYSASLHQHLLGKSSRLEILRKTGGSECLLDIPRWDFHWQRSYRFTESKVLNPGDKLKVTCHWDNSAAAQPLINGVQQTPRDVKWGENTTDEMCLGVVYVTN